MKQKKIFILDAGHEGGSFSSALAEAYAKGAQEAGHEVRLTRLSGMEFDPILHNGYKAIQELEPDLVKFQEDVKWCDVYVTAFPIWWSDVPARLKGLVDRVWLPGFAYRFRKGLIPGWHRLLKKKRARIITTSDSHPFLLWFLFGGNINSYVRGVLRFSGFAPVRKSWFSGMRNLSDERRQRLVAKIERLGRKGK